VYRPPGLAVKEEGKRKGEGKKNKEGGKKKRKEKRIFWENS